jgi:hypothetical protein
MGFDGLFFGRADYQDHEQRYKAKTMEFVWKASANLGECILVPGNLPNICRSTELAIYRYFTKCIQYTGIILF